MNNATYQYNTGNYKSGLSLGRANRNPEAYIAEVLIFLNSTGKVFTKIGNRISYEHLCLLFKLPPKVELKVDKRRNKHDNYVVPLNRVLATRGLRIASRRLYTEFHVVPVTVNDVIRNRCNADSFSYRAMSLQAGATMFNGYYEQFTEREFEVLVSQYSAIYGL